MIALWIILGILALLLLILILPIKVFIKFKDGLYLKFKILNIKIYEIKPENNKNDSQGDTISDKTAKKDTEKDTKNLFEKLKEKHGFLNSVKVLLRFVKDCLTHIKTLLRHIKIKKIILNISVASNDAATTAIEYGGTCAAAYPVLAFLDSFGQVKYKSININSDFNSNKPSFDFSAIIGLKIIFLIIAAFEIYKEYKSLKERENLQ